MNRFTHYLRSRQFFMHLAIIAVVLFILIYGSLAWLSSYTNHGEFVEVPSFVNAEIKALEKAVEGKDVNYKIIDSLYDPSEKPGIVLRQDPEPGTKVKHNRTVYLYVTGMVPPQIIMPQLKDRSERQARLIISSYGLKVGDVKEVKADCNGCVLEQLMKGRVISAGKAVPKGSRIDLLVGRKDAFYSLGADSLTPENSDDEN